MWGASASAIAYCSTKVKGEMDSRTVPLMGVLGAFIFAAQMINFTIPATGSSGHLGGGLLLAVLLGPHAALLTIASVLFIQALFFADGGLLALGCNIFNLGIFPAFIAYPFIYKPLTGATPSRRMMSFASIAAAVAGLQLGACAVVLETVISGISSLPFATFLTLMQPIHLAIGIVEGAATASVLSILHRARPDILHGATTGPSGQSMSMKTIVSLILVVTIMTGGLMSWFASENPDGLEWSVARITGSETVAPGASRLHRVLAAVQQKLAVLPDYSFRSSAPASSHSQPTECDSSGSRVGTSLSGLVGGAITLGMTVIIGVALQRRSRGAPPKE